MKISELAKRTHTSVETIRYYERIGLLMEPVRNSNNYRNYGKVHEDRLTLIHNCRLLGLSHAEIRDLIELSKHPDDNSQATLQILGEHIKHVVAKIKHLQNLEKKLNEIRQTYFQDKEKESCGILTVLSHTKICEQDTIETVDDIHQVSKFTH